MILGNVRTYVRWLMKYQCHVCAYMHIYTYLLATDLNRSRRKHISNIANCMVIWKPQDIMTLHSNRYDRYYHIFICNYPETIYEFFLNDTKV